MSSHHKPPRAGKKRGGQTPFMQLCTKLWELKAAHKHITDRYTALQKQHENAELRLLVLQAKLEERDKELTELRASRKVWLEKTEREAALLGFIRALEQELERFRTLNEGSV
mgnify:CR=1 FL=1